MTEKLTLKDNTELENSSVLELTDSNSLIVYTRNNYDLGYVFSLLNDPEKTQMIVYTDISGNNTVYRRYQKLKTITDEGNGMITAVLKKVYLEG